MNGDSIPDADHVLHHVNARYVLGEDIDGSAFLLRKDETDLSFNWMEYYRELKPSEQLQKIREIFPLKVKKKDRFVKLNVGSAKDYVSREHSEAKIINFVEDGYDENPSHCLMTGEVDEMMGDLLADCILEKFPAIQ